jgi:hypothetical protein
MRMVDAVLSGDFVSRPHPALTVSRSETPIQGQCYSYEIMADLMRRP